VSKLSQAKGGTFLRHGVEAFCANLVTSALPLWRTNPSSLDPYRSFAARHRKMTSVPQPPWNCPFAQTSLQNHKYATVLHDTLKISLSCNDVFMIGLKPRLHDTTCCQTGCVWQLVGQPLGQQVVLCTQTSNRLQPVGYLFTRCSRLSNRLYNRFDKRLYSVNRV